MFPCRMVKGCVVSQVRLPVGVDPDDEERLPVAWKLTGGTVHRRRNHRRARANIVDLEDIPSLTFLPKVTETADGLEDVAVGCVALVVNTL